MRYSVRIFLSIIIVAGLGFSGYGNWLKSEIKKWAVISIEDSLVDFSNILASYLSSQLKDGKLDTADFDQAFKNLRTTSFKANIHGVRRNRSAINAYVTDEKGFVVYDSSSKTNVGKDFSQWNDVLSTLKGEYGARFTKTDPKEPLSSVIYVAAPIQHENRIIGVISVSKPIKTVDKFINKAETQMIYMVSIFFIGTLAVAALLSYWLTRPVQRLIKYAQTVTRGESARPPQTSFQDFQSLGRAFDEMRISLEGKKSVEDLVRHLTHALKSPLTAIKAAAELLREDIAQEKKDRFLHNIETETDRASKLLERLLTVAALESRSTLDNIEELSLKELINETLQRLGPRIEKKKINLEVKLGSPEPIVTGERFWVLQILESLIINAVEFSPDGGKILIEVAVDNEKTRIFVRDQGPGIDDYAKEKIYDKFFSLERPSGEKSTGLGLTIVKEAILLHSGAIQLEPPSQEMSGANFNISFPKTLPVK